MQFGCGHCIQLLDNRKVPNLRLQLHLKCFVPIFLVGFESECCGDGETIESYEAMFHWEDGQKEWYISSLLPGMVEK